MSGLHSSEQEDIQKQLGYILLWETIHICIVVGVYKFLNLLHDQPETIGYQHSNVRILFGPDHQKYWSGIRLSNKIIYLMMNIQQYDSFVYNTKDKRQKPRMITLRLIHNSDMVFMWDYGIFLWLIGTLFQKYSAMKNHI